MALNLTVLEDIVKAYGAPLYPAEPTTQAGQLTPAEYTLMEDGRTIMTVDNGNTYYFPIRRSVIEAGFGDDKVFSIGVFTALRDAEGKDANGNVWTVAKGDKKAFAF
jgi:hypothetical protein